MLLGPDDPLHVVPQRILVCGGSGSGKSTLTRRMADRLTLPYTEMDSLYHGSGWTLRETFLDDVRAVASGARWVSEWQYDPARRFRREELWNGNREGPLWRIVIDSEHIIRWAWSSHPKAAARVAGAVHERPDLTIVRPRNSADATRWIARLSRAGGTPAPPR